MFRQKTVSKGFVVKLSIVLALCVLVFCAIQFIDFSIVKPINLDEINEKSGVTWKIEAINSKNSYVYISGWAFILKETPQKFDFNIVLKNTRTDESIELPTTLVIRKDLNETYGDGTDYSQSGFLSKVNKRQIDLQNNTYEIYLKYFNNDHHFFIKTNQTLSNKLGEQ